MPENTPSTANSDKRAAGWLACGLSGVLTIGMTLFLLPQWRHNPDLPHGWFTPLVFIWLIHEARTTGKARFIRPSAGLAAGSLLFLLLGLTALALGCLYLAVLHWTHALVVLMMTGSFCALLGSLWIANADARVKIIPFNWPAGVAILVWLLSIPLPPGTYATLTQHLQNFVTSTVLGLLHLCGIAAVQHGNVLQLPTVTVGVEEACSGVRSLLSCIYTGLFFSATLVHRPRHRVMIVLLAGPLAVAMNVVRSFILTLLAHNDVSLEGAWHDITGYSVLGVTAIVLAALALWLAKRATAVPEYQRQPSAASAGNSCGPLAFWPQRIATSAVFLAAVFLVVLFVNLKPAQHAGRTPPDLTALLPGDILGWSALPNNDLQRFADELQTHDLAQTTYYRKNPDGGEPLEISVYLAYWPAGTVPVSVVATHTPDACWPGAGWVMENHAPAPRVPAADQRFSTAEHRVFTLQSLSRNVWYWHLYDGRVIRVPDVRSPRQLLLLAWRYGFHREGEQLFVRVSSNQSFEKIVNEPILQEIFTRLAPFGL